MPKMATMGCVTDLVNENNVEVEAEAISMETAVVLPRLCFARLMSA